MDRLALANQGAPTLPSPDVISKVLLGGDLAQLTAAQKISYYRSVCESLGLNPLTQPFEYLRLSGREVLYAKRNCTDQLRHRYGISVEITAREVIEDTYVVTARASFPDGRHDESIGAVPIAGLKSEARSNALMKAETKAKRRVTLSLVGLSTLDESEVESIPGAQPVAFDPAHMDVGAKGQEVPPLSKSLKPSPGPAVTDAVIADPGLGVSATPANLNLKIPPSWEPFVQTNGAPITGRIVELRKSRTNDSKTTIVLESGETVTTFDLVVRAQALTYKTAGERVTITTKDTDKGKEVVSMQVATDEAF